MAKTTSLDKRPNNRIAVGTVAKKVSLLKRVASGDLSSSLEMLRQALADPSPTVRGQAVLLISEHGLTDALPQVARLLRDKSEDVRYDAAECVGLLQKGTGAIHPALRSLLSDKSALMRAQAAESLALIGDRGALRRIARLLSDRDPIVRSYAAGAIADLQGSAYTKRIEGALAKEKHELARVGLLEAAFRFGKRGALGELLGLLTSRDYHVRCSVANVVEFLRLTPSERTLAIDALKRAARKPLVFADASTVKRVLEALEKRGA